MPRQRVLGSVNVMQAFVAVVKKISYRWIQGGGQHKMGGRRAAKIQRVDRAWAGKLGGSSHSSLRDL